MAATKSLAFLLVLCVGILAASAAANTGAAAAAPGGEDFAFGPCITFVSEVTLCMLDVFDRPIATHPTCCTAVAKLEACTPSLIKDIPTTEWNMIRQVCSLWGVPIPAGRI